MNAWEKEYERRLRRVAGVTDDTVNVYVESRAWPIGGGCETCGFEAEVEIAVWAGNAHKDFDDIGALMRALAGVPDEG